jgi:hypothetical protein
MSEVVKMLKRAVGPHRIVYTLAALLLAAGLSACGHSSNADSAASDAASSSSAPSGTATSSSSSSATSSSSSSATSATSSSSSSSSLTATPAPSAKAVTLSWSPPTENSDGTTLSPCASGGPSGDCLAGYTLHYGTSSENYTGEIEITDPTTATYVLSDADFPSGTYYFAISAYNGMQTSSAMSAEVEVTLD